MKTLVTGGAGFIGSHLVDALVSKGHDVAVVDNFSTGKRENLNPKAIVFECDIRNWQEMQPAFSGIDYVFHCAALPRVPFSFKMPVLTHSVNVDGTLNVLALSLAAKVKKVIYSGSSSVYGNQRVLPLKEDMPVWPLSPYGLQKYVGERSCEFFHVAHGLKTVSLRYFNVYGPRQADDSPVIGVFLKAAKAMKTSIIDGDGQQSRDFTHVSDVVRANILAMESERVGEGEIINVGFGRSHGINQVARMIGGSYRPGPERPGDVRHTLADRSKAKRLLGWEPKVSLAEGIAELKKIHGLS